MRYDYRWYIQERQTPGRSYAKEHSYAEWVQFRRWEAGERQEYPLVMKTVEIAGEK